MNPYTELPRVPLLFRRHEFLVDIARGKRVLHLGCVDAGLLEERFHRGELLHQRLAAVTEELWGFDIDEEGIAFLQAKGFDNLLVGDVSHLDQVAALQGIEFDLILASEVVEHLQNPGLFFQAVKALMKPGHTQLVVTVPNAFRLSTLLKLLRGIEYVHPDHNYWFSYVTITNLVKKNGFVIEQVLTYTFQKHKLLPRSLWRRLNKRRGSATVMDEAPLPTVQNALQRPSMVRSGLNLVRNLPMRLLAAWLYHRTPFWADGLVVIAKVDNANTA